MKLKSPSLMVWMFLSVVLGITTGLFFGESCRHLEIVGRAFIAIMQISVLPYIVVSLIQSFGTLEPSQAQSVAKRGILMILVLWSIVFLLISLMPLCFPQWEYSAFFNPGLLDSNNSVDYIQLFIPSNPFNSLANNVVPAVTVFSILCGIVLMKIPQKQNLLSLLDTISEVLSQLTIMLVKLSPIGIFALLANAAGTMYPEEIGRLEVYLATFCTMGALLYFLILPLLLTSFTAFRYQEVMKTSQTAMLTVLLTGNLFIVLPLLVNNIKQLFANHHMENDATTNMAKIIVPITFILPCAGQLMDLLFIVFASWFNNNMLTFSEYLELYGAGLLTMFGSSKVAIPFLLSMFKLPADLFGLFLISSVVTDNIKFAVEAFAVFSFSILFTAWMTGEMCIRWRRLLVKLVTIVLVTIAVLLTLRWSLNSLLAQPAGNQETLEAMELNHKIDFKVFDQLPEQGRLLTEKSRFDQIKKSKVLRVGYNANVMPFAFYKKNGELVGFDIDMANMLAEDLECTRIEFYPISFDDLARPLNENMVDIVMSELSITPDRLKEITFTHHYLELSMALVVPDYLKEEIRKDPSILRSNRFTIAAMRGADYDRLTKALPDNPRIKLSNYLEYFDGKVKADALLMSAEKGSAWTIAHPAYSLFIPARQYKDLIAYGIANNDVRFLEYLNYWLVLKRGNGEIDRKYEYWIKGINVKPRPPRWSILRNVISPESIVKNPVKPSPVLECSQK
ncbi:MAG: cation:dicarboxylase symporter family transporter [Victivallaceae bacterium]|nr:cation:dicarboxylase symporter family transporter [Victivallaceae bacterium]